MATTTSSGNEFHSLTHTPTLYVQLFLKKGTVPPPNPILLLLLLLLLLHFQQSTIFDAKCQAKAERQREAHHLSLSPWAEWGCYWDILPSSLNRNVWWQNENKCKSQPDFLKGGGVPHLCYCQPQWERQDGASIPLSYFQVSGRQRRAGRVVLDIAEPIRVHYVGCLGE